jgi:flavin reductase (DIM6/NTAB) family NADH-FMN oxidoreductase RutF
MERTVDGGLRKDSNGVIDANAKSRRTKNQERRTGFMLIFDNVMRMVNRPVWAITAADGDRRSGLVATWVIQASLEPARPVVLTAIAPIHFTAEVIRTSRAFALHLLSPANLDYAWRLGLSSGRDHDKFAGLDVSQTPLGSPLLANCLAWFDCRVFHLYEGGDRLYVWADVVGGEQAGSGEPLRENDMFAAATPEQKQQLRANLAADIEQLRPLHDAWRART